MSGDKIFVGRKAELEQFKKVLEDPRGQAILVVGQAGMGKSMLANEVVRQAEQGVLGEKTLKIKCWSVSYHIAPTDDVNKTMEQIILEAIDAASPFKKKLGMTGQAKDKWRALFGASELVPFLGKKVKVFGDLLLSWGHQKAGNTRTRFIEALAKLSDCMSDEKRAIFIIDPEKWMPKESDHTWRLVVSDLPDRIKLIFPQRPDDALVISDEFCLMKKVMRVPSDELDVLDDRAIDDLMDKYSKRTKYSTNRLHDAVSRYKGHPYAVGAALELIEDGLEIEKLPTDPRPVAIAEAQWRRICERGDNAVQLFEAYAILEVAVPDEVVQKVSGLDATARKRLQKNGYLGGLLREEGYGKRIYHAILADHIAAQIGDSEKIQYHSRAVAFYREKLNDARQKQTTPDGLAATRLAEHVLKAEGEKAFVDAFVSECSTALRNLGFLDVVVSLSERALLYVGEGSPEEAGVLAGLGLIHQTRGDLNKAEQMHTKSLEISEKLGWLEGMANQYGNLGLIYRMRGDLDKAERMITKSLEIEEKLGQLKGMATCYANLGVIYHTRGDLDQAEQMHTKSLEIGEKLAWLEGMASSYGNLGLIYEMRGDLNKAEQMLTKALEIDEKLGRLEGVAGSYNNLGLIYQRRGDLDKAEQMFRKSLKIGEKLSWLEGMEGSYGNLGVIYEMRGDLNKAEQMFKKSLEINEKLERLEGVAISYAHLGLLYRTLGYLDKAEQMLIKSLEVDEKLGCLEGIAIGCGNLGLLYQTRGDMDKAEQMYTKALEINMKLGRLEGLTRQYGNLVTICLNRGDVEKARGYGEKALALYKQAGVLDMVTKVQAWIDGLKTGDGGQKTDNT